MRISKSKKLFALNKVGEAIPHMTDYELNERTYSYDLKLKNKEVRSDDDIKKIELYYTNIALTNRYECKKVTITKNDKGELTMKKDSDIKNDFDKIKEMIERKVYEIDAEKFKKFFPDYTDAKERDDKLEELLGELIPDKKTEETFIEKVKRKWKDL